MNQKKIGNVKKFYAFIKVTYNIKIETALWFVQVLLQKSHRHPYFTINKLVQINFNGCQGIFQISATANNLKICKCESKCQQIGL
jgi:hypothetical protein